MKNKKVSIIIPCYNEIHTLKEVIEGALNQKYKNKEIIVVGDNPSNKVEQIINTFSKKTKMLINRKSRGLAGSLNRGINVSKGEIIVTLLADCVPSSDNWLSNLLSPFSDKNVLATCSSVYNDDENWEKLSSLGKELLFEEQGEYFPLLDEKGCAYRKTSLKKIGLFDEVHFKTAGEDFDTYIKLSSRGKIISEIKPSVIHRHPMKDSQIYVRWASYARGFGALLRIHGIKIDGFFGGILRALFPFWAIGKIFKKPKTKISRFKLIYPYLKLNYIYAINFFQAYIKKTQWK